MVTTVRVKDALEAVGEHCRAICCSRSAAPACSRLSPPCWCSAARSPPVTATASTTPSSSRCSAPRAARLIGAYALEYLLLGTATALFARAGRLARGLADRRADHAPALCLAAVAGARSRARRGRRHRALGLAGTFARSARSPPRCCGICEAVATVQPRSRHFPPQLHAPRAGNALYFRQVGLNYQKGRPWSRHIWRGQSARTTFGTRTRAERRDE